MKNQLNHKVSNTVSFLAIITLLVCCCSAYAQEPDELFNGINQDLSSTLDDLVQCTGKNHQLVEYIKAFQQQILQTCQQGGVIEAVNGGGDPIIFYCSPAAAL